MANKNRIVIFLLVLIVTIQSALLIHANVKLNHTSTKVNTPFLKSVSILGNEIQIDPNVYVYRINTESGELKGSRKGCEVPVQYEVNKIFGENNEYGSVRYLVNGEKNAYFYLNFKDNESGETTATYYFDLWFETPIKIADGC